MKDVAVNAIIGFGIGVITAFEKGEEFLNLEETKSVEVEL
jgi:hypothetical protein